MRSNRAARRAVALLSCWLLTALVAPATPEAASPANPKPATPASAESPTAASAEPATLASGPAFSSNEQSPPASDEIPAPADVIGFAPGTDYELADYGQISAYFRALDAASDRIELVEIGDSTLGKPMLMALISSPENLRDRERYREISRRLALVRGTSEEEARRLAAEGKAIVWIDGGLHATEVAHGQMTPVLAHWLVSDESEEARRIRDDVILLLMVNVNPDGLDIVADWYRRNLGTPFETAGLPELYHHYVGHDNNRDWYNFTQVEHQNVADVWYHRWFPQVIYNHHQSGPFPGRIWMPPVEDPINPNIDPLVVATLNHVGESMKKRFMEEQKPGGTSRIVYDGWWSGYMSDSANYHNMVGLITETALYRYATPRCYEADDIPETFGARADNLPAKIPSTTYPLPWLGGCWHLADAIDYMMTASKAVLDVGAKYRQEWLYNIWAVGRRQIDRGERAEGGAYAYIVDMGAQRDPGAAAEMLTALWRGGIDIRRAEEPFSAGDESYPAGTYVMGPQPFRPFLVDLMDPKEYPDSRLYPGGPPDPPYDMTGYELPLTMGVTVDRVDESFPLPERQVTGLDEIAAPGGSARTGSAAGDDEASTWMLSAEPNASVLAVNRLLAAGGEVWRAMEEIEDGGRTLPAGTLLVRGAERSLLEGLAAERGLDFTAVGIDPATSGAVRMAAPKVGLYKGWVSNMAEGWDRWLLERYEFDFDSLTDADVRGGDLSSYDVIVLSDQGVDSILHGHLAGTMPEQYTGGVGLEGALALQRFVERGGWLVAIDSAVDFPIDLFGLPVENTVRGLDSEQFFIPGSLIRLQVDTSDPLAAGLAEDGIAFFVDSQALRVVPGAEEGDQKIERDVVTYANYAEEDFLASGWALGAERRLAGRAAAMRVPLGQGNVVLLAFRPNFRGQTHNTYKLLFNALYAATLDPSVD